MAVNSTINLTDLCRSMVFSEDTRAMSSKNLLVLVAAGRRHTACVTSKGVLFTWGNARHGELGDGFQERRLIPQQINSALHGGQPIPCRERRSSDECFHAQKTLIVCNYVYFHMHHGHARMSARTEQRTTSCFGNAHFFFALEGIRSTILLSFVVFHFDTILLSDTGHKQNMCCEHSDAMLSPTSKLHIRFAKYPQIVSSCCAHSRGPPPLRC